MYYNQIPRVSQFHKVSQFLYRKVSILFIIFIVFFCLTLLTHAQTQTSSTSEQAIQIRSRIEQAEEEITRLEGEILQYQKEVSTISQERQGLEGALGEIQSTRKKLEKDIKLTQQNIERQIALIMELDLMIGDFSDSIIVYKGALRDALQSLRVTRDVSLVEILFFETEASQKFTGFDDMIRFQRALNKNVQLLTSTNDELFFVLKSSNLEHVELEQYREKIDDQKEIVVDHEKDALLKETKNSEQEYRAILAQKEALARAFQQDVFEYESQLKFILDPTTLPPPGSAPLGWPLDNTFITQRFGVTSTSGRLYSSGSHSGTDFRAAVGTAVLAAADGTVRGTGDTDTTCSRASFGKWIFIEHTMGLSTAYGHLSKISVSAGDSVKKGDIIGYSGNTGHSTAPHLHLSVYATQGVNGGEGVRIADRPSSGCPGKVYTIPVAPTQAYLDPESYLPKATREMYKAGA